VFRALGCRSAPNVRAAAQSPDSARIDERCLGCITDQDIGFGKIAIDFKNLVAEVTARLAGLTFDPGVVAARDVRCVDAWPSALPMSAIASLRAFGRPSGGAVRISAAFLKTMVIFLYS